MRRVPPRLAGSRGVGTVRSGDSAEWEDGRGRGRRRRHRPWPGDDVRQGALQSGVAAAGDEAAWGDSEGLGG